MSLVRNRWLVGAAAGILLAAVGGCLVTFYKPAVAPAKAKPPMAMTSGAGAVTPGQAKD